MVNVSNFKNIDKLLDVIISKLSKNGLISGEYVSPVIRRSLSNITGNLKKAVCLADYCLNTFILEFLSLVVGHQVKIWLERLRPIFCLSMVVKITKL